MQQRVRHSTGVRRPGRTTQHQRDSPARWRAVVLCTTSSRASELKLSKVVGAVGWWEGGPGGRPGQQARHVSHLTLHPLPAETARQESDNV